MTYIVTAINEDILARKIEIVKQEINKNNENIEEKVGNILMMNLQVIL